MPSSNASDREAKTGFVVGKRVWLASDWDGNLLTKRFGRYGATLTLASTKPDAYGRLLVTLADGTEYPVRKSLLRLTPPPSATGKTAKAKAPKEKPRKEAVDPALGEELPLF